MSDKSAAILTIKDAADMSPQGIKDICDWLESNKKFLKKHAKELCPIFRSRYMYK